MGGWSDGVHARNTTQLAHPPVCIRTPPDRKHRSDGVGPFCGPILAVDLPMCLPSGGARSGCARSDARGVSAPAPETAGVSLRSEAELPQLAAHGALQ